MRRAILRRWAVGAAILAGAPAAAGPTDGTEPLTGLPRDTIMLVTRADNVSRVEFMVEYRRRKIDAAGLRDVGTRLCAGVDRDVLRIDPVERGRNQQEVTRRSKRVLVICG